MSTNSAEIKLDDKYTLQNGRIYLTGSQALVRLTLLQAERDISSGLNTGCLVSGYRGSPMHNVDREFWSAGKLIREKNIHFQPAVNEDLAATALWGSQQAQLHGGSAYDGVYAMWYGKGPGLDRSVDAIRHANLAGTSRYGGVLAAVGDDPAMMSTDTPAVSEPTFADLMMPVLYPGNVQEILDYGQLGWAMSRYCGSWVGFKIVSDSVDTAASVNADYKRLKIIEPVDFKMPAGGLNIRIPDPWREQESRQTTYKLDAACAFARANKINQIIISSERPQLAIVASGKAALDCQQSLLELGINSQLAAKIGISLIKIGMPHPLDPNEIRNFVRNSEKVLVVEDKRRIVESQIKDTLYNLPEKERPTVIGRNNIDGSILISGVGELNPNEITQAIASQISLFYKSEEMSARLSFIESKQKSQKRRNELSVVRTTTFCSGCPHNSSTKLPEGSRAHGGVGCHFMAVNMDRRTTNHTHMGGEGATWIGQEPFVQTDHIFQNLGDGTYYHSGLLGIRACVAAKSNITFKILFNDAVAMTGGQPHDGPLTPALISRQVYAEGVKVITVVSDEPDKYNKSEIFAPVVTFEHRKSLDRVQRSHRKTEGVSVIIYDQTCAAEKRRRRKRGTMPDPSQRLFINETVCEGCGDCTEKSSCISILPIKTEFGLKRSIDQSSCNKDFSCSDGFCPSFVSVIGSTLRKTTDEKLKPKALIEVQDPLLPKLKTDSPYKILVTGIGGTGVATIGALLTMAAHIEGLGCAGVDQFGMAQKGGPVTSHIQIAKSSNDIKAVRLTTGSANLLLACDKLVGSSELALATIKKGITRVIVNSHEAITGQFTRDPELDFPSEKIAERLIEESGKDNTEFVDATRIATSLMGDSIATNLFMLGYAYQKGLIPVSANSLERAIEINGIAIEFNKEVFTWGRLAATDKSIVEKYSRPRNNISENIDQLINKRTLELSAYQNSQYANSYIKLIDKVREIESERVPGEHALTEAVARCAFKLMAYKDEYEVARLYTHTDFKSRLNEVFDGNYKLQFHLAPPFLNKRDKDTGLLIKRSFGPWILKAMIILRWLKFLRGTKFDIFGYTKERQQERQLIKNYRGYINAILPKLTPYNHKLAVEIATIPDSIRGFGHVKSHNIKNAQQQETKLMKTWNELC